MMLINLLIRELNNCSFGGGGYFRVSHHSEMCYFVEEARKERQGNCQKQIHLINDLIRYLHNAFT